MVVFPYFFFLHIIEFNAFWYSVGTVSYILPVNRMFFIYTLILFSGLANYSLGFLRSGKFASQLMNRSILKNLPFYHLSVKEFEEVNVCTNPDGVKQLIVERLDDHGFWHYLYNLSKSEIIDGLDTGYYTCAELNKKVRPILSNLELSVFHLNIRSLNSKQGVFCQLMELLELEFDVIVLSEIWSTNIDFYENIFDDYIFYSDIPSTIGGVGMYVKGSLRVKVNHELKIITQADCKVENLWIEINKHKTKYVVGGIYRHPNQNVNTFNDILSDKLAQISRAKKPCIIVGDINIDFMKITNNNCTKDYLNNLLVNNCLPMLLMPTRITEKSATLIDHIYYYQGGNSKRELKIISGNIFSDISDHLPNFILLACTGGKINYACRPHIRLYTVKNKSKFAQMLGNIDWSTKLYNNEDVNYCYDLFIEEINRCFNASFPLTRLSRKAYHDKKWITKGLKKSSARKDELYQRSILSNNPEDKIHYKNYKRIFSLMAKKAEILYYNRQFDIKTHNIKQLWTNLNKVFSASKKGKKQSNSITRIKSGCKIITSTIDIANEMNDYFSNIGQNLVKLLPANNHCYSKYLLHPVLNSIYSEPVTATELLNLIELADMKKSAGPDNISVKIVKDNKIIILQPLLYLFNLSLDKGVVPDNMKLAKVIPVFKKGDSDIPSNYRPISLLSVFDKLIEKIVHKRIYNFLDKYKILYDGT